MPPYPALSPMNGGRGENMDVAYLFPSLREARSATRQSIQFSFGTLFVCAARRNPLTRPSATLSPKGEGNEKRRASFVSVIVMGLAPVAIHADFIWATPFLSAAPLTKGVRAKSI
jgi:hypothetical protein